MIASLKSLIKNLCYPRKNIAIIGCGASGIAIFYHLVRNYKEKNQNISITVFDKNNFKNKGVAYSTTNTNHYLNICANRMGILYEDRSDFIKWLKANEYDYYDEDFVPRFIYALYLESILELSKIIAKQKGIKYQFINKEISKIKRKGKRLLINNEAFSECALAIGIPLKNNPKNFWFDRIKNYLNDKEVYILGSGLTSLDAIISLQDAGYNGTILVHSHKGLMPLPHNPTSLDKYKKVTPPLSIEDMKLPLSQIFRKLVKTCKNSSSWQELFDSLRPITWQLWRNLDLDRKKRFLRHCLHYWNIHRHRYPKVQYQRIEKLITDKKLFFTKEKPITNKLINCTEFNFKFKNELIKNLVASNIVKYDDLHAGIISLKPNFHIIGGANFGSLFETTDIPEITTQSNSITQKILAKLR